MTPAARLLLRLVSLLLPRQAAGELIPELEEGFVRRRKGGRPWRWLLREVVTTPYPALWRQERRLLARGVRPRESGAGSAGPGVALTGLGVAVRSLARRPGYAAVAVATVASAVAAVTVVFSLVEGVLLRPLPYAERVHVVFATDESQRAHENELLRETWDRRPLSRADLEALRGAGTGVGSLGAHRPDRVRWKDAAGVADLAGSWVAPGFLATVGAVALEGRLPTEDEVSRGAPVVVVSERVWTERWGSDADVLGRTVRLDGRSHAVVGVLPRAFSLPSEAAAWWAPLPPDFAGGRRDAPFLQAVARLDERATPAEVEDALARRLATAGAPGVPGRGVRLTPLEEELRRDARDGLLFLLGAAGVLVAIATVNLANLVVARTTRRRAELALRAALGGGRVALAGAVLGEVVLVCLAGGAMGLLVAGPVLPPLVDLIRATGQSFPSIGEVGVDLSVAAFALAVVTVVALVAGGLPAWVAAGRSPWRALREGTRHPGGRRTRRTQRLLLAVEAGLAVVLLVGAGLLLRSLLHVGSVDPGFRADGVAVLEVRPTQERYPGAGELAALEADLAGRLAGLPGVEVVGVSNALPASGEADMGLVRPPQVPEEERSLVLTVAAGTGYFRALDIPLLRGRGFQEGDGPAGEGVVLSELLAGQLFGEEDPVGRTVLLGTGVRMGDGGVEADGEMEARVVGVVGDVRQLILVQEPRPVLYRSLAGRETGPRYFTVRTAGDPSAVLPELRPASASADPDLLVGEVGLLRDATRRPFAGFRLRVMLVLALAGLSGLLTLGGVYGVVAYVVSQQRHEVGLRMALGAGGRGEVGRMVLSALRPVVAGGAVGTVAAFLGSGVLESILFGVQPLDPATYLGVLGALVVATSGAAWVPARRAAQVDPVRVLAGE